MTMTEVEKSSYTPEFFGLDAKRIKAIQTSDGWHNIKSPKIIQFAVTSSPTTKVYSSLMYVNEWNQTCYTPLSQIVSFSTDTK